MAHIHIYLSKQTSDQNAVETAIRNAGKFFSLQLAIAAREKQHKHVPILKGPDGRFWVPSNMRETEMLLQGGLSVAQRANDLVSSSGSGVDAIPNIERIPTDQLNKLLAELGKLGPAASSGENRIIIEQISKELLRRKTSGSKDQSFQLGQKVRWGSRIVTYLGPDTNSRHGEVLIRIGTFTKSIPKSELVFL